MANCVTNFKTNINLGCETLVGGATELYLLQYDKFDKTATQANIDDVLNINKLVIPEIAVVDVDDKFWKIESPKGVIASTSESTKNEQNRTFAITQTLVFNIYTDALKSTTFDMLEWIQTLLNGTFLAVVKNSDGSYLVVGFDNGCTVTAAPFANGVASGDLQAYTITLTASAEVSPMRYILDASAFTPLIEADAI